MRHCLVVLSGCLLIIGLGCAVTPPAPPQPRVTVSKLFNPDVYNRVAVYVIDRAAYRFQAGDMRQVEDEFMRAVIEKGYTLAARSDIDQIKRELDVQASGFTEEALARKARALNVSAILLVSINDAKTYQYWPNFVTYGGYGPPPMYFMGMASISARLISAELAQVVWISSFTGEYQVSGYDRGGEALAPVARIVASGLPSR